MATFQIDGGILAGGLSRRMHGQPKGLVTFSGQPMVHWVAQALSPYCHTLLINCNQHEEDYSEFADLVCADLIEGYLGPLAGLHSLLKHTKADYVLTATCDSPKLDQHYGLKMISALEDDLNASGPNADLYCARSDGKVHPLHLLASTSLIDSLESQLIAKNYRVMKWLDTIHVKYVDFDDPEVFANFNSPEDLK